MFEILLIAVVIIGSVAVVSALWSYSNLLIKQYEIESQNEKARAGRSSRFYVPLLRDCYTVDRRIGHILAELHTDWLAKSHLDKIHENQGFVSDPNEIGYFLISSVYIFACFLGWVEAIKKDFYTPRAFPGKSGLHKLLSRIKNRIYSFLHISNAKTIFLFDPDLSILSKLFQYRELFDEYLAHKTMKDPRDASRLNKQFQYAIGELMLEKEGAGNYRCKSFREFFDAYLSDPKYRYWFVPLENLFIDLCEFEKGKDLETQAYMKNDVRPLRLLAIRYWCRVLMKNISTQLEIEPKDPGEVLSGISDSLKHTIQTVEVEKLESYLLEVRAAS
jgi:hypothetical protein